MLGVTQYEGEGPADTLLRELAEEMGVPETYSTTRVGVFFGEPGKTVPDPYFGGEGPPRAGCIRCGACMVGCRHNAKNTLVKNYLYFAERAGVADPARAHRRRGPPARRGRRLRRLHASPASAPAPGSTRTARR